MKIKQCQRNLKPIGLPLVAMRLAANGLGRRGTWILLRRSEREKRREEDANESNDFHLDGTEETGRGKRCVRFLLKK